MSYAMCSNVISGIVFHYWKDGVLIKFNGVHRKYPMMGYFGSIIYLYCGGLERVKIIKADVVSKRILLFTEIYLNKIM